MNQSRLVALFLAGAAMLLPSLAFAQSQITGVVKDSSGAVLASATVVASSDVLIEKSRTVQTNGEGRYTMVDLRPGTYVINTTAQGFSGTKQTVEVPANVSVTVDAELKVGSVGETVEVEARIATVDTENAAHPTTLTRDEMDALPTGRYMQSIGSYVPGAHLNLPDIGGSQQVEQNYISVHGNGSVHDTYVLDGLLVNTTYSDGQIQQYIDNAAIQESTYTASNVGADASGGGMLTSLIPKDGSNNFHLNLFAGGSGGNSFWQGNNTSAELAARGTGAQSRTVKIQDLDGSFGGPIKKDKIWFMMTGRQQITFTQAGASTYPNGDPGVQDGHLWNGSFRLTWQANQNNKFSAFWLRNWKYKGKEIIDGGQGGFIPADPSVAATQRTKWPMYYILQTKWTGTPTSSMVLQAGISLSHLDYNDTYQDGLQAAPGTPQFEALVTQTDTGTLRRYVAGATNQYFQTTRNVYQTQATYIAGAHQIRSGVIFSNGPNYVSEIRNGDGIAVFTNGLPVSFTAYNTPYYRRPKLTADIGAFVMDTWHYKRLAVTAGMRFEYLAAKISAEVAPAGRFAPARSVPEIDCNTIKGMGCWKNWTPRIGIVYDVFGNHKTALKAGFGKYNSQYSTGFTDTFNPMALQTQTVTWNFGPTTPGSACAPVTFNGVIAPNPNCYATGGFSPQGTATSAIPVGKLGPSTNPTFGSVSNSTGIDLDPNWHRDYNLQYNLGVQQEVMRGLTLNLNWYRRSQYQQNLVVNTAIGQSGWTPVSVLNPLDGSTITMFNLQKAVTSNQLHQTNAPRSLAANTYTGYEASVVYRRPHGVFGSFGWTMDRQLDRSCAMTATGGNRLNDPNTLRFCDVFGSADLTVNGINVKSLGSVAPPWAQAFTAQGSIPVKYGFILGTSFLSNQYQGGFGSGTTSTLNNGYLARTWSVSNTTRYPVGCIGCDPIPAGGTISAAGAPNGGANCPTGVTPKPTVGCIVNSGLVQGAETVNLVSPGQVRTPRLNQFDLSLRRTFKFKEKYTLEPEIQAFNILNTNAAVAQSVALGSNTAPFLDSSRCSSAPAAAKNAANCGLGGTVTTITNPRLLRIAVMFKF